MSHNKERKEKNCLNCNAEVMGKYCQICGQENVETKETFWHLVTHFVYDITHFDGKFFSTLMYLLRRPGFLSYEYMRGRRASYLNPIRMYIFTSAFFFVFFFSIIKTGSLIKIDGSLKIDGNKTSKAIFQDVKKDLLSEKSTLEKSLLTTDLSSNAKAEIENELNLINADIAQINDDTTNLKNLQSQNVKGISFGGKRYSSVAQYDSIQISLPISEKDNWLERKMAKRNIKINAGYKNDSKRLLTDLFEKFLHTFPQILFLSLPIFALILQLLYVRHKKFYYADHIIFTVHLYCAMFIIIFLQISITKLEGLPYLGWIDIFTLPIFIYTGWYIYRAIKYFYGQGYGKTALKFILLLFLAFVSMTFLFSLFLIFSVFTL